MKVLRAAQRIAIEGIQEIYRVSKLIVCLFREICDSGAGRLGASYFAEATIHPTTSTLALARTNSGVARRSPSCRSLTPIGGATGPYHWGHTIHAAMLKNRTPNRRTDVR
jgi:hypothetical protein